MIRVIKRYESRKLYDTEESRYVSLEDISSWVRAGQEIRVVDNGSSEDVTAQILTQIIHEEGKSGRSFLPSELLHELVRTGERAISSGVEHVQGRFDRVIQASIDRLGPVRKAREEMAILRDRLVELESTLSRLESDDVSEPAKATAGGAKTTAKKTAAKKAPAKKAPAKKAPAKTAARKTTPRKTAARKTTTRKSVAKSSAAS